MVLGTRFSKNVFSVNGKIPFNSMCNFLSEDFTAFKYGVEKKVEKAIVANLNHEDSNYFHFVTEYGFFLSELKMQGVNLGEFKLVFQGEAENFPKAVFDICRLFEISSENCIFMKGNTILNCEKILLSKTLIRNSKKVADRFAQVVKSLLKLKFRAQNRHLLIQRAKNRRFIAKDPRKSRLKLEEIQLENVSFKDQVELFAGAREVWGAHGAGLTNAMFMEAGTKINEVFSWGTIDRVVYRYLSSNLDYKSWMDNYSTKSPSSDLRFNKIRLFKQLV